MKLKKQLLEKINEACQAVLPICFIVTILACSFSPLKTDTFAIFVIASILLVLGMGLFTLGAEMSMTIMGEEIGARISKSNKLWIMLILCFILGTLITMAEPDLSVLANQIPSINNQVIIITVSIGVGLFLIVGQLRNYFKLKLNILLSVLYAIVFILCIFVDTNFIPVAFDAAGVTTGPITVPFILAFGIGLSRINNDDNANSFGLISLCSIGPILAVLILSFFYSSDVSVTTNTIYDATNTYEVSQLFIQALPSYIEEVFVALLPITIILFLFQLITRQFTTKHFIKCLLGLVYTFIGLVLFLTSANLGFLQAGSAIGENLALSYKYLLVPIGALIGYFIVKAEPAVIVLTHQVEEISNGAISAKNIELALSLGVASSIALAMIRIITGINILWFLLPGYAISLILSFIVDDIYTSIAFDSGGVASGPMTATFLLPFAQGACIALGGNILSDAFGIVAMVAMTPLITIQLLGLFDLMKKRKATALALNALYSDDQEVVYLD